MGFCSFVQLNPAVSLGAWVGGQTGLVDAVVFGVVQASGAFVGACLGMLGSREGDYEGALGGTPLPSLLHAPQAVGLIRPEPLEWRGWQWVACEVGGSFLLVTAYLNAVGSQAVLAPLALGGAVFASTLAWSATSPGHSPFSNMSPSSN